MSSKTKLFAEDMPAGQQRLFDGGVMQGRWQADVHNVGLFRGQ